MLLQSKQFLKGSGQLLSPTKKAELDSKMSILEARWGRLQAELDNRYMRLVKIHEKLTKFEELLHPFLVCTSNEMFRKRELPFPQSFSRLLQSIIDTPIVWGTETGHRRADLFHLKRRKESVNFHHNINSSGICVCFCSKHLPFGKSRKFLVPMNELNLFSYVVFWGKTVKKCLETFSLRTDFWLSSCRCHNWFFILVKTDQLIWLIDDQTIIQLQYIAAETADRNFSTFLEIVLLGVS